MVGLDLVLVDEVTPLHSVYSDSLDTCMGVVLQRNPLTCHQNLILISGIQFHGLVEQTHSEILYHVRGTCSSQSHSEQWVRLVVWSNMDTPLLAKVIFKNE